MNPSEINALNFFDQTYPHPFRRPHNVSHLDAGKGAWPATGVVMLIVGMIHHVQFMMELKRTRQDMKRQGLIHGDGRFPVSITFMVSLGLLLLGFAAVVNMVFKVAVFG